MVSPPCQPYSTADMQGATKAVVMIPLIRDNLSSLGGLYSIENVEGASREMQMGSSAVLFYTTAIASVLRYLPTWVGVGTATLFWISVAALTQI